MTERQLRAVGQDFARALMQRRTLGEEPFIVSAADKAAWAAAIQKHAPVKIPFPELGLIVPLAWMPHRYLALPLSQRDPHAQEMLEQFCEALTPGRGYGIINVDQQQNTAVVCEFVRMLH